MQNAEEFLTLNLQLFAEGGAGEGGTSADGATADNGGLATAAKSGGKGNPLADVVYGKQDETQAPDAGVQKQTVNATDDRTAKFEELIKGEYKDLYDARVQDTVQKRLKNTKETVDKYEALAPTLEMLGKKYGVDATDIAALNKAIEDDDAFYEQEAMETGLTVQQVKGIRKMERENADLKRQMQENETKERASRLYASWMEQSEQTKGVYPTFDLQREMQNPKFTELLRNNVDVRTAYEVLHKDEIIPAAMQFTAKAVEQKLTNKIIAGGNRPTENGMNSQSASLVKSDVSQLSKADRAEINRRVARGEKIRF